MGPVVIAAIFWPGKASLSGRSARVVVTMATPALVYRWYFRAQSVKSLERSLLGILGIALVHETLIGLAADMKAANAAAWLTKLQRLGAKARSDAQRRSFVTTMALEHAARQLR